VLSDRLDRRHLMIAGDAIRGVAIAAIGVLSIAGELTMPRLIGLVVVYGARTPGDLLFKKQLEQWAARSELDALHASGLLPRDGYEHLREIAAPADRDKIHLVYHGIDFARFPDPPLRRRDPGTPLRILSVGRAVPKKGYADLLQALALLPREADWRFDHVGGGPLLDDLRSLAETLQIAKYVTWHGAQPQDKVLEAYRAADIFTLASCVAEDGDRDGLPNVLMEAQSQRLPVVATELPGIAELVIPGETGLLVPPRAPENLSAALLRVIRDADLRERLAEAGLQRVRRRFSLERGIDDLERRFREDG